MELDLSASPTLPSSQSYTNWAALCPEVYINFGSPIVFARSKCCTFYEDPICLGQQSDQALIEHMKSNACKAIQRDIEQQILGIYQIDQEESEPAPLPNVLEWQIKVMLSSTYPDLNADYPRYIKNLDKVLKLALPWCSQEGLRIEDSKETTTLKMRHRMFEEREKLCYVDLTPKDGDGLARKKQARSEDVNESGDHDSDTRGIVHIDDIDDDIIPEFRIHNLPVNDECRKQLNQIIPTHTFNPLCVLDYGSNTPILPANYQSKLRGAVAEIRFTLTHWILKKQEGVKSNFNAIVDEIIILGKPTQNNLVPSKVKKKQLFTRQPKSGSDTQGNPDNRSPKGSKVQNQPADNVSNRPAGTGDQISEGLCPKRTHNK